MLNLPERERNNNIYLFYFQYHAFDVIRWYRPLFEHCFILQWVVSVHLNKNRELGGGGVNNFPAVALYTGYILPNSRRVQGPPRCPISSVDRQRMLLMGLKRKLQLLVAKKRPSLEQLRPRLTKGYMHIMYESRHKVSS